MPSLPHAKPLLATAAGELHLHPAVLAFVILAVTVLISRRMIPSLSPLVAPRPAAGEPGPLLHPTGTVEAAAAPPVSAPRSALPHLAVLCVAMGAVLHAEPLVAHASAELGLDPSAVACGVLAVATLFNWAIAPISRLIAARADEREPKTALPPLLLSLLQLRGTAPAASTVRPSSLLARSAFAVLAALVSASWFVEPFAAAAELRLPGVAVAIIVVLLLLCSTSRSTASDPSSCCPAGRRAPRRSGRAAARSVSLS
ncbi:hypothetical protein BAE44_0002062 [Dichanthelium oligosanthes]|uniref:Uncharacterized protein n=1 Tax=Dichanthelium oligosanthes TaxID=888268 RepID=A0A1E5WHP0_9POAL|nr:hypothetical protein BAE44_0002062 [Dichanthelium oligosanthes]